MRTRLFVIGVVTVMCAAGAYARDCKGVSFPEQTQVAGSTLTLNGLGLRQATIFKVNVYVAALYVVKTSGDANAVLDANAPYEMVLHFVRDVGTGDIAKGWNEGMARNSAGQPPGLQERLATLSSWMADLKSGQRMIFSFKPGAGVQVTVDGTVKGTINGDDFGRALLSMWLGVPPNPELKAGLLGGACG